MRRALTGLALCAALSACGTAATSRLGSHPPAARVPTTGTAAAALPGGPLRIAWTARIKGGVGGLAVGAGGVWVTTDRELVHLDPASGKVVTGILVGGVSGVVTTGGGSVWAAFLTPDRQSTFVVRIDPQGEQVAGQSPRFGPGGPTGIAFGNGAVWVATRQDGGAVYELDPSGLRIRRAVPGIPSAAAVLARLSGQPAAPARSVTSVVKHARGVVGGDGALWAYDAGGHVFKLV